MAIIKHIKGAGKMEYAYLNIFPDQFKSEKEKQDDTYVKETMDYFANKAYNTYITNRDSFVKNYDLLKGILTIEDFYQESGVKSFTDMLTPKEDLPLHVKQYSIMTTPVNELVGEITKRPDTYKIKAFDDDSKSEELQFKTDLLQKYVLDTAKAKIMEKAAIQGQDISEEQLEQLSMSQVQDQLDSYTSVAEKWANHQLTASKMEFNTKEMSEDSFRDLIISSREFYHIYEDNSKTGFNVEVSNPKNTWYLSTPDYKYTSDPSGRNQGAYAAGTVKVMELSEIIESCPELSEKEINHLRTSLEDYGLLSVRESNLGRNVEPGIDSIVYDTYDPLVLQERQMIEAELQGGGNDNSFENFIGQTDSVSSFGYKYSVVVAYWVSKKKVGRLEFEDDMGNIQSMLVDENYVSGAIPTQTSLEWGWINQWYQGKKIGPDIYHSKPFDLLTYCPIIGTLYEIKNTQLRSVVDLMKPFQVIYNVALNQLYELLEKEIGQVQLMSLRHIPIPKDGDAQDALDMWEAEARDRGVVFIDDSPENLKAPSSFNQFTSLDLTRTKEIQSRYTLAQQMKMECWELVGMTKQRMGQVTATETATGTNTAVQQSYTQTEPLFVAHEYVQGMLFQAIIDASLYIESANETTTLSYVTSEGESSFVKVNGTDLRFRDLKVYPTNRPEDSKMFSEIRALSQAVLQNGGSLYDIIELYTTKSQRDMKKTFKDLKDQQDQRLQAEQDQKQQALDQSQKQFTEAQENLKAETLAERENENYQNQLDRINKKEVAAINALRNNENALVDADNSGIADSLEITNQINARTKANQDFISKMAAITEKSSSERAKLAVKREEIQEKRDNQANDLAVAKVNARGRGASSK